MNDYYNDYLEFFSNRLIKLRKDKGVSAREMSLSLGQSKGYIGSLERKRSLPSMTIFLYICDYLGITPKDFFDDSIENPALFMEVMNNLKGLDTFQLTNINNIIMGLQKK